MPLVIMLGGLSRRRGLDLEVMSSSPNRAELGVRGTSVQSRT